MPVCALIHLKASTELNHEPLDILSQCIEEYCHMLWSQDKSIKNSFLKGKVAARLREKQCFDRFILSPPLPCSERFPGDDYVGIMGGCRID